jgi:hypothetical protein
MSDEKKARWLHTIPAMGRSIAVVLCTCGHENRFYLWSWSGHGKAKCKGCGMWIFTTLEVGKDESVLPEVRKVQAALDQKAKEGEAHGPVS